jgi:uncharacterized SAM-binding protein YcdF (DUF218 family)
VTREWPKAFLYPIAAGVGLLLLLAALGHFLVVDDPLAPADAIVALAASEARAREAAALYHRGLAPRIVLARSRWPQDPEARVLLGAGVPATAIVRLPRLTGNTSDELQADFEYAQAQGFRRVILVTSPYHTRRVGLLWRQIARGRMPASVRATPYERFDPMLWWASSAQLRSGLHELGGIAHVLLMAPRI